MTEGLKRVALRLLIGVLGFTQMVLAQPADPTGSIGGVVTGPGGVPVTGVAVAAVRVFPLGGIAAPAISYAATDAAGVYLIPDLPAASYKICVMLRGVALLDPCLWAAEPPLWNLDVGQAGHLNVTLEEGAWLHIRLDDSGEALTQKEREQSGPAAGFKVRTTSGALESFAEIAKDRKSRSYRIVVPREKDVALLFDAADLEAEDRDGKPIKGDDQPTTVRVGNAGKVVQVKIK